jgi:putative hydroxymethylpyrimidine transport system substrate-binding protein
MTDPLTPSPPRFPRFRPTTLLAAATLLVIALLGAGCGEKSEESGGDGSTGAEFNLALDFYVNPDHAGIYTAIENGYFAEAGLDVKPQVPSDPSAPIKQVAAGRTDLAISYEPEVMLARDQGLDVVAVAALVQRPLTSLISLPEGGIAEPKDLAGKRVVTAGIPYQTAYLETILRDNGVAPGDVEQIDVGLNLLQPVLSGSADAMFGGFLNVEGVQLEEEGLNPRVESVDELGIPTYDELVLVANGARLEQDPEEIRLFLAGLERGTADATADPQGATDALLEESKELDPELTLAQVKRTLPYFQPPEGKPYGWMDAGEWLAFSGFLADQGQIQQRLDTGELFTNDLLPGGEE